MTAARAASSPGLDQGERVTIPALPDLGDWTTYKTARAALLPNLSHRLPAKRYAANTVRVQQGP